MSKRLRVLVVEDSQDDTDLLLRELRRGSYNPAYERVESAEAMQTALNRQAWDIVISDYSMPHFSAPEALALLQESGYDVPFIIISGTIGEERAVAAMKAGANDYLMKGHLARLVPVIERELREARARRKQRQAEVELNRLRREQERQARAQVNRLSERINTIFETANEVIILAGDDGHIDMANPAVTQKFGYSPEELAHRPLSVLADPSQRKALERWLQEVIASGQSQRQQILALYKDGSTFEVEISLARIGHDDNQVVCILHDISHFKEIERIKDNFISMVSHELRSPITSLSLIADGLHHFYDRYTDDQIKERLANLTIQSHLLIELIEGILDISRLEAQAGQLVNPVPVDVAAVLANIVAELQADAIDKKQTITSFSGEDSIIVTGSHLDFGRIWRNLISNAIKYSPEGGQIRVSLEHLMPQEIALRNLAHKETFMDRLEAGRRYVIGQVEDSGHGIDPADLPTLFQRFNRGWAQSSNIPGTGLGLALVRELLTIYKGDIAVASQLGQGSTFTFWIPTS